MGHAVPNDVLKSGHESRHWSEAIFLGGPRRSEAIFLAAQPDVQDGLLHAN